MFFDRKLRPGYPGIRDTVVSIVSLIRLGSRSPIVRRTAERITETARDDLQRMLRVFYWIKRHLSYRYDPEDIELIKTPERMLREISSKGKSSGDCDDFTVLVGSLLGSVGIPVRVRIVRTKGNRLFNHVLPEARYRGDWIPLDAILKESKPGRLYGRIEQSEVFQFGA